jgi:hypothetical protein
MTPELLRVLESIADAPAEWAKRDIVLPQLSIFLLTAVLRTLSAT